MPEPIAARPAPDMVEPRLALVDQRVEVPAAPVAPQPAMYAPVERVRPMVVRFPASVRLKAGLGLVVYVTLTGLALGVVVLAVAGAVAKAAGQI